MRKGSIETCSWRVVQRSSEAIYRRAILGVTIVAVLLVMSAARVPTASAQNQPIAGGPNIVVRGGQGGFGGGGFFPYGGGGFGWGMPGTAQSSAEFGMASMIAASGYANLQNSIATRNYLAARSQDFDNRLQWTRAYYDMRREHRAYVADHTRLSMDEITKIANDAAPKRLDATQLDPTTGKIAWPIILQDPRYVALTDELENLYKSRAVASNFVGAENYQSINRTCEDLLNLLRANIDEYQPNDFIQARRFVESLRYESRFPTS
jgi:hypothetical protein